MTNLCNTKSQTNETDLSTQEFIETVNQLNPTNRELVFYAIARPSLLERIGQATKGLAGEEFAKVIVSIINADKEASNA